ncbi:heavy metal-binding domain-containing protein [Pedobacter sp. NJ-S-72]
MKNIITVFLLIFYSAVSAQEMKGMNMAPKENSKSTQATYTCPMHPEIQSNKPGNCPKCGMKLVVQKAKAAKPKSGGEKEKKTSPPKNENMGDMQSR